MKTCFEITRGFGWPIKLSQHGPNSFRVTYGEQVEDELSYGKACAKLGQAIMHALSCEGNLDNEDEGEGNVES